MRKHLTLDEKWKHSIMQLLIHNELCSSSMLNKKLNYISIPTIRRLLIELQDDGLIMAELHYEGYEPRAQYMNANSLIIYNSAVVRWKITNLAKVIAA